MLFNEFLSKGKLFISGEIGQNHNGDVDNALKLIDRAVMAEFSAVKFTKRDISSELTKEAYNKPYDNPNSFGKTYGEHREFLELSEESLRTIKQYCDEKNIIFYCTACDRHSVELLERIGNPIYKVASRDLTNLPLLELIADTKKDVILSTGMATLEDIDLAVEIFDRKKVNVAILQCTSQYPTPIENANLNVIKTLKERYHKPVGYSDHTSGVLAASLAVVIGAELIEKHITLSRTMKGTDHPASLEFQGMLKLTNYLTHATKALGSDKKEFLPEVQKFKEKLARSLVLSKDLKADEPLTEEALILKSPGTGIEWKDRHKVLNKKAKQHLEKDTLILEKDFY